MQNEPSHTLPPRPLGYPTLDIDRFDTPYTVTLTGENSDNHNWYGLGKTHCLFPNRGSNLRVNNNPNDTTLTFSLGNGHQSFTSPVPVDWQFEMNYYFDLGSVDLFMVDFQTVPSGRIPDVPRLYAYDTSYVGGSVGWHIRVGVKRHVAECGERKRVKKELRVIGVVFVEKAGPV